MNLIAYDIVEQNMTKGHWIIPDHKRLQSRELEYRKYYCFLKKYNTKYKCYDWYLALLDEPYNDAECHGTVRTKEHVIKIDLRPIWDKSNLKYFNNSFTINIDIVEQDDTGIIYKLDI